MTDDASSPSRRLLIKQLTLIPAAVIGIAGCAKQTDRPSTDDYTHSNYRPAFFNAAEWEFLLAACDCLIPADETGPGALQAGVPEFIDRHMQTPYAAGDIWYMQGPFLEAAPEFGYQGRLAVRDMLRVGIKSLDAHCRTAFGGKLFAQLEAADKEVLLKAAEAGKLQLENISSKDFFAQLLGETRLGYFSDPKYGGNKDMAAWKMIGYPGARADYIDWVEVRDRAYPLPPVDLSGRRG